MNGPSIIMDPKKMFQTLETLENQTDSITGSLVIFATILQKIATLTYAIGFGALIKKAEADMNQVGNAVVAANNTLNTACKEVVNQLVEKFAPDGARSDYGPMPFKDFHIKVNLADRAAIYPQGMQEIFDLMDNASVDYKHRYQDLLQTYETTKSFWAGQSADQTRLAFKTRVVPKFKELFNVMIQISMHGQQWLEEAVKFEASLGVQ